MADKTYATTSSKCHLGIPEIRCNLIQRRFRFLPAISIDALGTAAGLWYLKDLMGQRRAQPRGPMNFEIRTASLPETSRES